MIVQLWVALALAEPLAMCTDRGALVGTVSEVGQVDATLDGALAVTGTLDALRVDAGGDVVFRGPLRALGARPSALHPPAEQVAAGLAGAFRGAVADGVQVRGGGFDGRVGSTGVLRGQRDGHDEVWALDADGRPFGGPAALRAPLIDIARTHGAGRPAVTVRVAADHLRAVGFLLDCGRGGEDVVGIGAWPEPVALPEGWRVTDGRAGEVLLRDPDGAPTWLTAVPADRDFASDLLGELRSAHPELRSEITWSDGVALVGVSRSAAWDASSNVSPSDGAARLLPVLEIHPAVLHGTTIPGSPGYAVLESGREVVALLNHHRAAMGQEPLAWDAPKALAAALHAAWLERAAAPDGHRQQEGEPLFVGERPADRGGASEVVHRQVGASGWQSVDAWLAAPYHRVWPLHPSATSAGAVALVRARVAEVVVGDLQAVPPVVFPPEGSLATGLTFDGHESPDPLPLHTFPDRVWPVGYPVSLWVPVGTKLTSVDLEHDGRPLEAYAVTGGPAAPRDAVHVVARDPLPADSELSWTARIETMDGPRVHRGTLRTPADPWADRVPVVRGAALRALDAANTLRQAAGTAPLAASGRAEALARWIGARTRAVAAGLPGDRVKRRLPTIGRHRMDGAQRLCLRPGDDFDVDETWLDPEVVEIGLEEGATTVTWSTDPATGTARKHVASPRTCVLLLPR